MFNVQDLQLKKKPNSKQDIRQMGKEYEQTIHKRNRNDKVVKNIQPHQ